MFRGLWCVAVATTVGCGACFAPPPEPLIIPAHTDAAAEAMDGSDAPQGADDAALPSDGAPDHLLLDDGSSGNDGREAAVADGDDAEAVEVDVPEPDAVAEVEVVGPTCKTAADCPAPAACHGAAWCEPTSGECVYVKLSGTPCEDGDICTELGACEDGVCVSPAKDCEDGIACSEDSCDSQKGCRHDISKCSCTKDQDCDDGDLCTQPASCESLSCVGGEPVDCSHLDAECTVGKCDSRDGSCVSAPRPDGAPCEDSDPCTAGDGCLAGICKPGGAACGDANPCTTDLCHATTGACSHVSLQNGLDCDDGDECTIGDACNLGACKGVDRLDTTVSWEATLGPVDYTSYLVWHGVTASGASSLVAVSSEALTLVHTGGTTLLGLAAANTPRITLVRLDPSGNLLEHQVIPADGPIRVDSVAYTPGGGVFALVEHSSSLAFGGGKFYESEPQKSEDARTLVYFSAAADVVWTLRFEPDIRPLLAFYSPSLPARVGVVAVHRVAVSGPVVVGPAAPPLPAAVTSNWSLSLLTWTLAGTAVVARDVGSIASWSFLGAKSASDGSVAMCFSTKGSMSLSGLGQLPWTDGSVERTVLAQLNAAGDLTAVATAQSPNISQVFALDYDSTHGAVASVFYSGLLAATDATGNTSTIVEEEGTQAVGRSCFIRLSSAGELVWPLNCGIPGNRWATSFLPDGAVSVLADGFLAEAPAGGRYGLGAPSQAPKTYLAEISAIGEFRALGLLDTTNLCTALARGVAGQWMLGCWKASDTPDEGKTFVVQKIDALPPPQCEQ